MFKNKSLIKMLYVKHYKTGRSWLNVKYTTPKTLVQLISLESLSLPSFYASQGGKTGWV